MATVCKHCHLDTFTYNGWCNKCSWEQMNYWFTQAEKYAAEVRSFTRKTLFVQYEREREQRIHGTDND